MSATTLTPHTVYLNPERVSDGEGGWTAGTLVPSIMYLRVVKDQTSVRAIVRRETELNALDVIEVGSSASKSFYQVVASLETDQGIYRSVSLEKVEKPITQRVST